MLSDIVGPDFLDSVFRIQAVGDITKEAAPNLDIVNAHLATN